jgi:hypothetical protein
MDFDSRDFGATADDGQGQALEQGELDMDLKGLSLKGGEPVGDGQESRAHRWQLLDSLLEEEVLQIIATGFETQEGLKFFILFDEGPFKVSA